MTFLEQIEASFPLEDDFGELFKDHLQLTKLEIGSNRGTGYTQLTQLKSLGVSVSANDDVFQEVLALDKLTELSLPFTDISEDSLALLSKLTNLENITSFGLGLKLNWKTLERLPKLSHLTADADYLEEFPNEDLNNMTKLTYLDMDFSGGNYSLELDRIKGLTNLQYLSLNMEVRNTGMLDFSGFKNLTSLYFKNTIEMEHIQLPQGLKIMSIVNPTNASFMNGVFSTTSIEELSLFLSEPYPQISQLRNLKTLLLGYDNVEQNMRFCRYLMGLVNLRRFSLSKIYEQDIDDLKQLTQLCKLRVTNIDRATLNSMRQQLPFSVYKEIVW